MLYFITKEIILTCYTLVIAVVGLEENVNHVEFAADGNKLWVFKQFSEFI